jgi:hypothetical protein
MRSLFSAPLTYGSAEYGLQISISGSKTRHIEPQFDVWGPYASDPCVQGALKIEKVYKINYLVIVSLRPLSWDARFQLIHTARLVRFYSSCDRILI